MKQWCVLFGKEMLEMRRNLKWLWVPIVFILLGIMQPVVYYFMPQILQAAGGLPEGAIIDIPPPQASAVMAETFGQFGSIGLLVLVLAFMGIVAGERQSRTAGMILVRPVPRASFITAKWAAACLLALVSVLAGSLAAWFYTSELIGDISLGLSLLGALVFGLWIMFVMTVTVFLSTIFKSNGAVASLTLLLAIGLSVLTGVFSRLMTWSPSMLTGQSAALLADGAPAQHFGVQAAVAVVAVIALLAGAIVLFKRQEEED